jgi:nucleoside-diphosphate-sugar epimerase
VDMQHRAPSITKIREAIGWLPTLDLDRILSDVIQHARATAVPAGR